jgi:hypothetical protein
VWVEAPEPGKGESGILQYFQRMTPETDKWNEG